VDIYRALGADKQRGNLAFGQGENLPAGERNCPNRFVVSAWSRETRSGAAASLMSSLPRSGILQECLDAQAA
jgi:hypothetical protein